MTEPYIPFYKPYGMSDAEYASEIDAAHRRHEEWALEQQQQELVLANVSNQRKLLLAFERYLHDEYGESIVSGAIDNFITHISE
jgi:hypothetical protein